MGSIPLSVYTFCEAPGVKGKTVTDLPKDGLMNFIKFVILNDPDLTEPFYVLDLGVLASLMDLWTRNLPTVPPHYAVKCNPDPSFLGAMAALGSNFDCASRAEIESLMALGVDPGRIVYANPCKEESHIKYAASVGVNLATYDSRWEVEKIRKWHPKCGLLVRIKVDETGAIRGLGLKYGALPEEFEQLLTAAGEAKVAVRGVSFHVGGATREPSSYRKAIALAKTVFDAATRLGLPRMDVLNIGGGFTTSSMSIFEDCATAIKSAVQEYFGNEPDLKVIAEPGRFFAQSPFTLATSIIGKRMRGELREYWINDGVYGSMNCVLHQLSSVTPIPFVCRSNGGDPTCRGEKTYCSTVFGPTCDAMDTVATRLPLPEMEVGDWMVFQNMGAYTKASGTDFNGFRTSAIKIHLVCSEQDKPL
ncbi:ornithine decarboxylase [Sarracenia purpurea var. burkii]